MRRHRNKQDEEGAALCKGAYFMYVTRTKRKPDKVLRCLNAAELNMYFRVTVYSPAENLSAIMDSNGLYEKLWQFSSFLLSKGFKVIEVSSDEKFLDGNLTKTEPDKESILLRAHAKGEPVKTTHAINGVTYRAIQVGEKIYIPDKTATA